MKKVITIGAGFLIAAGVTTAGLALESGTASAAPVAPCTMSLGNGQYAPCPPAAHDKDTSPYGPDDVVAGEFPTAITGTQAIV
ncbi:hypothetical protein AAFP30_07990 [Gordonia sp. CPCC 205515]|uniref:hypothetical protein n=1 Tax=Gordonia sp. CPCC 205515 TaxID=3140791 RepID=UPI003AF3843B